MSVLQLPQPAVSNAAIRFYQPDQIRFGCPSIPVSDLPELKKVLEWMHGFIMKPHEDLGRTGDVCPYVKPAMQQSQILFGVSHLHNPDSPHEIMEAVLSCRRQLTDHKLSSLVLILPDILPEHEALLMEPVHKQLKTQLLREGIMIGQFYPSCQVPSTYNPGFLPLQSPVPLFALRYLIESDWRFLQGRSDWQALYRERFGQPSE